MGMDIYDIGILGLKVIRKMGIYSGIIEKDCEYIDFRYVEYFGQSANDLIYNTLQQNQPCMIAKFGTNELQGTISHIINKTKLNNTVIRDFMHQKLVLYRPNCMSYLLSNAGVYPANKATLQKFSELMVKIISDIDILSSYIYAEKYIENLLNKDCKRIDLDGLYAPWLFKNPWTKILKNKKVLVIHPFAESIYNQYNTNRKNLFSNPDVLPEFKELKVLKAVQSLGGHNEQFKNWFEALDYMKGKILEIDFDIALIGCGAFGMPLASFIKNQGKQAVHLGGWVQMLFGIYGKRWIEDQPQYKNIINEFWIRPQASEKPKGADIVEGGCYW